MSQALPMHYNKNFYFNFMFYALLSLFLLAQPNTWAENSRSGVASFCYDAKQLGALSERYESAGKGVSTVSSGKGDFGCVSYGIWQFSSCPAGGTVSRFLASLWARPYAVHFHGLQPGTEVFSATWRLIAGYDREAFRRAQYDYLKASHYDVLVRRLARRYPNIHFGALSPVVHHALWSTAIQHGPTSAVTERALRHLTQYGFSLTPTNVAMEQMLLRALYGERRRRTQNGRMAYFRSSALTVQQAVDRRLAAELQDALSCYTS